MSWEFKDDDESVRSIVSNTNILQKKYFTGYTNQILLTAILVIKHI